MAFETEDSSRISWFMGTIASVQVSDPIHWPNSPWRLLQVIHLLLITFCISLPKVSAVKLRIFVLPNAVFRFVLHSWLLTCMQSPFSGVVRGGGGRVGVDVGVVERKKETLQKNQII